MKRNRTLAYYLVLLLSFISQWTSLYGCQFFPSGEYLRFVRVPENLQVGGEVLRVQVHPRRNLMLQALDRDEDASFFTWRDLNRTHVSVVLANSLEDLVDSDSPQNVLKFRLGCDSSDGNDTISSYLSVTVYVEDVNDHSPVFIGSPYHLTVDELTPTGLSIFRGIQAVDRDKPNTPNSDIQFSISDSAGRFSLESSHRPTLLLTRPLDYDKGDHNFTLFVTASDRGSPPRSANTTLTIIVQDNDDLGPRFTQDVYTTNITEFFPLTGTRIHHPLKFDPPISAFDQDRGLDAILRYDIITGNDRHLFSLDGTNATLYLNKEIDLDAETSLPGNKFVLQIQATQVDNPLKTAIARVEVEILDLNDNLPEFEVDFYNISIVENLPNGFSVLQVMASDRDQGENGEFLYQLFDPYGAFSIDPRSGWLTVRDQNVLDREQHSSLKMKVYAKEKKESVVGKYEKYYRKSKRRRFTTPKPHRTIKTSSTTSSPIDKTTYVFPDKTGFGDLVNLSPNSSDLLSYVNVEVTLLDANDNNPVFLPSNLYEFSVKSNAKVGDFIGKVIAVDPDLGRNGLVLYDLQRGSNLTVTSPFLLESQTGALRVAETPLPFGRHALFIEAADQPANPSERRFSLAVASVDVLPSVRIHKPSLPDFIGAPYEFWVGANVLVGTSIGQIRINDAMDKEHIVYDLLHSYPEGVPFAVEERSGTITVVEDPAKFRRTLYDFEGVVTQDGSNRGRNPKPLITNVTVHVVDPEDERGILMKGANNSPIEFHVRENLAGAVIGQLLYQNHSAFIMKNSSRNIHFIIANQQDVTDDISIGDDGTLFAKKALDREKRDVYRLTLIAEYSKGSISGAGIYQVTIHVDDENDNAPIFNRQHFQGFVNENSPQGTAVNTSDLIQAKDADSGANALFTYTLRGDGNELFKIDHESGKVYFTGGTLDRETKDVYNLWISAKDEGNLSSEAKLTIHIQDVNDNAPIIKEIVIPFEEQNIELLEYDNDTKVKIIDERDARVPMKQANPRNKYKLFDRIDSSDLSILIPENVAVGTKIMRIQADDDDIGDNGLIKYSSQHEILVTKLSIGLGNLHSKQYFVVNENSGEMIVARILPPEYEFRMNISATDGGGLHDDIHVTIMVKDVNDHPPVFKKSWYTFDIEEGVYSRSVLGKIEATDADYGKNANVTYKIISKSNKSLFEVAAFSGIITVNGDLDREKNEFYIFNVVAEDNGIEKRLSSSVTVEVHVLDVNDNAPQFYGYDQLIHVNDFNFDEKIPVYKASLNENSLIGTKVMQIYANDSDFSGNGNGLFLFDILRYKNQPNLFLIDSKDGTITTSSKLDYETSLTHNITIIASDLGSPSLTSTAFVLVDIVDISEPVGTISGPVFTERYYEIEIEENSHTPVELLTLNRTHYYRNAKMKFYIVNEDMHDIKKMFVLDPRNATLYLVRSPDREMRDVYEIIVRAEKPKVGRNLPHMIYPVPDDELIGLTKYDVKIVVKIKDINDNPPRFTIHGRPIVAAITTTSKFGQEILRLQATDPDLGLNGEIVYQLLSDHSQRFSMDPITGQVRTAASFLTDAGKVFGFDVKATDKAGADDGKSAIANVFVYVLDERREVVLAVDDGPLQVQAAERNITSLLGVLTGLDVRVRRLEPQGSPGTDTHLHIYAVDPLSNSVVDMDNLQRALVLKQEQLEHSLPGVRVVRAGPSLSGEKARASSLRPLQLGALVAGAVLVLAAMATALCIVCFKKNKRMRHRAFSQQRLSALRLGSSSFKTNTSLFPGGDGVRLYGEVVDEMQETVCPHGRSVEQFGIAHQQCVRNQIRPEPPYLPPRQAPTRNHEPSCVRFNKRTVGSKRKLGGLETSITSVHSSGQDSGIAEGPCPCGHSTSQEEEESSNGSYEDSLKSSHKERASSRSLKNPPRQDTMASCRPFSLHASMVRRHPPSSSRRRPRQRRGSASIAPVPPPLNEPVIDYDQSENEGTCNKNASRSRLLHLSQPSLPTMRLNIRR